MTPRHLLSWSVAAAATLMLASCGGGEDGGGPTAPSSNAGPVAATITIDATGSVSPKDATVPAGSRVTFVNNDSRAHEMASDPHPTHGSCRGLDQVGRIEAGQSRTSGNLNAGVCTYHDHLNDTNENLRGTIRVQ